MEFPDRFVQRLVIGVGNDFRGDDAAGLAVVRRLSNNPPAGTVTRVESGDNAGLIDAWQGFDEVVIVDAASSGSPQGTVFHIDASTGPIPEGLLRGFSTHAMSIGGVIELARTLGRMPARLIVCGIEGREFAIGAPMSPEVLKAAGELETRLRRESSIPAMADWV